MIFFFCFYLFRLLIARANNAVEIDRRAYARYFTFKCHQWWCKQSVKLFQNTNTHKHREFAILMQSMIGTCQFSRWNIKRKKKNKLLCDTVVSGNWMRLRYVIWSNFLSLQFLSNSFVQLHWMVIWINEDCSKRWARARTSAKQDELLIDESCNWPASYVQWYHFLLNGMQIIIFLFHSILMHLWLPSKFKKRRRKNKTDPFIDFFDKFLKFLLFAMKTTSLNGI